MFRLTMKPSSGSHNQYLAKNCCVVVCILVLYCSMYCMCVNVYCHRVTTQLQLTNISISIKIQAWFNVDADVVQKLSVLWRHNMTSVACELCTV